MNRIFNKTLVVVGFVSLILGLFETLRVLVFPLLGMVPEINSFRPNGETDRWSEMELGLSMVGIGGLTFIMEWSRMKEE